MAWATSPLLATTMTVTVRAPSAMASASFSRSAEPSLSPLGVFLSEGPAVEEPERSEGPAFAAEVVAARPVVNRLAAVSTPSVRRQACEVQ